MTTRAIRRRSQRLLVPPPGIAFPASSEAPGLYVGRASDPGYPYRATGWASSAGHDPAVRVAVGVQPGPTAGK